VLTFGGFDHALDTLDLLFDGQHGDVVLQANVYEWDALETWT
jgi:hypothetical protein